MLEERCFSTSLSTLTNGKSAYFSAMFSGRWQISNQDGEIFIDRDPMAFSHVLNLLRGEEVNMTVLSPQEKLRFEKDLEFFQIESPTLVQTSMAHTWAWSHLFMSENGYTLSGNVATKDKSTGSMYIIRAVPAIQRTEAKSWKISIECDRPITEDLDIGVISYECIGKDCWLRSDPLAKYIQNPIQGSTVFQFTYNPNNCKLTISWGNNSTRDFLVPWATFHPAVAVRQCGCVIKVYD